MNNFPNFINEAKKTALEIIDEKNERIRKLEIAILTLAEVDPAVHDIQSIAKQAVVSFNIKCGWNNKRKGEEV